MLGALGFILPVGGYAIGHFKDSMIKTSKRNKNTFQSLGVNES